MTESPNGTYYHTFTNMRSWGCYVSCWPVYQSDKQMSPFTSNFTSYVAQTLVKKWQREGEKVWWLSTSEGSLQESVRRGQYCLMVKVVDHSGRKVIKCKGTITIKGCCNDSHEDLKVIMWFIMVLCNQIQHYFCCLKIIIKNVCQTLTPPPHTHTHFTQFFSSFHVFSISIIKNITSHNCTC